MYIRKRITRDFNSFDELADFISELTGDLYYENEPRQCNRVSFDSKPKMPRVKTMKVKKQPEQQPKQESGIFNGLKMYYNPEKHAFTVLGPNGKKAIVHKNKEDKEDVEKAMLYCLLKYYGVRPGEIWDHYADIKYQGNIEKKEADKKVNVLPKKAAKSKANTKTAAKSKAKTVVKSKSL